jgi:hypothetical protein
MRRLIGLALLSSAFLLLTAPAQEARKRDYFHLAEVLVYVKGIDQELKLSQPDFEKVRKIVDAISEKNQAELDDARRGKDGKQWRPTVKKVVDETNKALSEVLSPQQMERLRQILRQRYAFQTLEENAKVLGFTADQQKKIDALSREYNDKGLSRAQEKAIVDRAVAIMTPEQRKTWDSLVGPWYVAPVK